MMEVTDLIKEKVEAFFEHHYNIEVEGWDCDKDGCEYAIIPFCPLEEEHTTNSMPPVWVYLEPYVKISCLHKSCEDDLWSISKELWNYLGKPDSNKTGYALTRKKLSPEALARAEQRRILNEQKEAVIIARESGLITCEFGYNQMPINHKSIENPYTDFIQAMFSPQDVLWTGEHDGSGKFAIDNGKCLFATARELIDKGEPLFPFISNSVYKTGSERRKDENILEQKYCILEWDNLTHKEPDDEKTISENLRRSWTMFSYTQSLLGLNLRAICWSGNKSYHYWVEKPSEDKMIWLRHCASELKLNDSLGGLDTSCLGSSQPCRCPQYFRKDKDHEQKLMYLAY